MRLRVAAFLLAVLPSASAWAAADLNKFVLTQSDRKQIGTASFTIETAKDGSLKVRAKYEYKLDPAAITALGQAAPAGGGGGGRRGGGGGAPGVPLFGQFTFEYKTDSSGAFLSGFTQDMANQKITSYQPGKAREQLTISQAQGGQIGLAQPMQLPKPEYVVAPTLDPSALQMLLTRAMAHPAEDKNYLVVIQGPGGQGNTPAYVVLVPAGSAKGTLDGKEVAVRRFRLNFNKGHADLFADETGKLMEADMDLLATDIVRSGFKLAEAGAEPKPEQPRP